MPTHVYGAVDQKGNVAIAGSGDWTAEKTDTGTYKVTFNTAFASPPVVVASGYITHIGGGAASDNTVGVGPITETGFVVRSYDVASKIPLDDDGNVIADQLDNAGQIQDSPFTFIAIG